MNSKELSNWNPITRAHSLRLPPPREEDERLRSSGSTALPHRAEDDYSPTPNAMHMVMKLTTSSMPMEDLERAINPNCSKYLGRQGPCSQPQ